VGDWGYNSKCHGNVRSGCQGVIADAMKDFMQSEGDRFRFIVNVGDSFYCDGVNGNWDGRWKSFWHNVYVDDDYSRDLTRLPWYSVYGNHDMGSRDPCPCDSTGMGCKQVQNTRFPTWVMPNLSYSIPIPELNIEIIGLDTNFDWQGAICEAIDCGGGTSCYTALLDRTLWAEELLKQRYQESTAKTLVVFSHYPVDYLGPQAELLSLLGDNSKHNILYFGGHRHNTDQAGPSIGLNEQWLVGGGGGYGCDGGQQGYVKAFVWSDGTITTEGALVETSQCCYFSVRENGSKPAPSAGSVEVHICEGENCVTSVLGQGMCSRIRGAGKFTRMWCETNEHVKIEILDDSCDKAESWRFVPQNQPVARGEGTMTFRCDKADSVPLDWMHPAETDIPDPDAKFVQTIDFSGSRNPMKMWV